MLSPDPALEQFITPFRMAQRRTATNDGSVSSLWSGLNFDQRFDARCRDGFDRERSGHAGPVLVHERLIVERLLRGRLVVGDGLERDVRDFLATEAAANSFVWV